MNDQQVSWEWRLGNSLDQEKGAGVDLTLALGAV